MDKIKKEYRIPLSPQCNPDAVVQGEKYRFTILTPSIIRMEYSENGIFEDRATQVVLNRCFPAPPFTVEKNGDTLKIFTQHIELTYHTSFPFCEASLSARFYGEWGDNTHTWRYMNTTVPYGGNPQNYWGTLRSLDDIRGRVPLEKGLMGPTFTEWDDSRSMIISDDGWVEARPDGVIDTYLFAYAYRHVKLLHDFLAISGKIPMLPRYALGNWWSRYYAYTSEEYLSLVKEFEKRDIPLSVACLDMDWHITDIDVKYGTGWSGYTWNKDLFPNHKEFLKELKSHGLRVMLNIHDREGITPYEDGYAKMAEKIGVDCKTKQKINFDFGTPEWVEAYFESVRHPLEADGVDFWWYDGFPENTSTLIKADMPFMINHFNYLDNQRNGNRGMLLSRRSGMGGHRYGIGFSGDTWPTWEMLDFLPYFTSTASNVGFGWWSHDVGGFMNGIADEELLIRWEQFSVFSPINRFHSANNPFMRKEPWVFDVSVEKILTKFMRLRHELIPYIYTMNYRCWADNITLIRPLYYYVREQGHSKPNEYFFGDDMLVAPITAKGDSVTNMGHTRVWLPEGLWFDFFNNRQYIGNRNYTVYRRIDDIPVFVKAGSVIPQAIIENLNDTSNPSHLKIDIFPGANHKFALYEDDGVTLNYQNGKCAVTDLIWEWSDRPVFTVSKPVGETDLIPALRSYTFCFHKISPCSRINVTADGIPIDFNAEYENNTLTLTVNDVCGEIKIEFLDTVEIANRNCCEELDELLMKLHMSNADKWHISQLLRREKKPLSVISEVSDGKYDRNIQNALTEVLLPYIKE